ncbi:glycosyltransferase [Agromyces sp. NPDC057865]|uniref:glycosyltransferase n=1 Tax=Agromyces sp. NPDC057865 TaxID=3346267 RepID=UPI00366FD1B6
MRVLTALDGVYRARTIVEALRLADDLTAEAGRDARASTVRLLSHVVRGDDELTAVACMHALGSVHDEQAGRWLVRFLSDDRAFVRQHAAWALGAGQPRADTIGALFEMTTAGGFSGMLAQQTLERWSSSAADLVVRGAIHVLARTDESEARARVVETMGLVPGPMPITPLADVAMDASESDPVRATAVSALGQRPPYARLTSLVRSFTATDGSLAEVARLTLIDMQPSTAIPLPHDEGLTVAQLFLHADIDSYLSSAGSGDNGGIATLLVRLGDALASDSGTGVGRVLTLSRGSTSDGIRSLSALSTGRPGHSLVQVPLYRVAESVAEAWPMRAAVRLGIRRILQHAGNVDLLHLRMADVGSLAAADVARDLGIPYVFTLAPDPHALIDSLEGSGALRRDNFGRVDFAEHFWFRAQLVQRLAAGASRTVLFPRPRLHEELRRLVGIDLTVTPARHAVVPEGVDMKAIDLAIADVRAHAEGGEPVPAIAELRALIDELSPERRGLPLIVSLGRLHRVKGMATLVRAWARSPLQRRANLLIIGGNLERPSFDERQQLELIEHVVPSAERSAAGLLLPGHRANDIALRWLAAARLGLRDLVAPGGVYACASVKEEFGIAVLEAMGTGLLVVTPDAGGPATYVEDDVTGILTATTDVRRLRVALDTALTQAGDPDSTARSERSQRMVRDRFTIERMSELLGALYREVAHDEPGRFERLDVAK